MWGGTFSVQSLPCGLLRQVSFLYACYFVLYILDKRAKTCEEATLVACTARGAEVAPTEGGIERGEPAPTLEALTGVLL